MKKNSSYDKYTENDQFVYDEKMSKNGIFTKHDCELYNDDDNIPGAVVRVKRLNKSGEENWQIFINGEEGLLIKGSRFTEKERVFLRSPEGMLFMIKGIKCGWNSVSEFKKQIKVK